MSAAAPTLESRAEPPQPASPHSVVFAWIVRAGLAVLLLSRLASNVADLDLFHLMALAREIFRKGAVPFRDSFAYTPTLPVVVQHEWGTGVLTYLMARYAGTIGILAGKYLITAVLATFILAAARRCGGRLASLSVAAPLGIAFIGPGLSPIRGHLFTFLFTAVLLWCLERDRAGDRRWIPLWLLLFPVWLNLHGGFVVGIGLMGVYAAEQIAGRKPWLHLFPVGAAMAALIAVNPYGFRYYPYLWNALTMSRPRIPEWLPIWRSLPSPVPVLFLISLLLIPFLVRRPCPGLGILAATAAETLLHGRMLPLYGIAFTAYVPGLIERSHFAPRLRGWFASPPLPLRAAWMFIVVFFLAVGITSHPLTLQVPVEGASDEVVYPAGAVRYLATHHFRGNLMTPFSYGAFVSWKLYPAVRVSMDSRYEVAYPGWWADESFRFYDSAPGWRNTLGRFGADLVLLRPIDALAREISSSGWNRVYRDRSYEIYARPGLNLPVVDLQGPVPAGEFP
jgi:hypothetical protein